MTVSKPHDPASCPPLLTVDEQRLKDRVTCPGSERQSMADKHTMLKKKKRNPQRHKWDGPRNGEKIGCGEGGVLKGGIHVQNPSPPPTTKCDEAPALIGGDMAEASQNLWGPQRVSTVYHPFMGLKHFYPLTTCHGDFPPSASVGLAYHLPSCVWRDSWGRGGKERTVADWATCTAVIERSLCALHQRMDSHYLATLYYRRCPAGAHH